MADIKFPDVKGEDENGNVRPGDDRYLSEADSKKVKAYVVKVQKAEKLEAAALKAEENRPAESQITENEKENNG